MTTLVGRRFDTGESVRIESAGSQVTRVSLTEEPSAQDVWLGPGLFDLQINGFLGQEFNDMSLTEEAVEQISLALDADGVTSYLPTATTHSFEMLSHTMKVLASARRRQEVSLRVPGFHLEGPYLSPQDGPRGAHPLEHIRAPDWDEFQRLQESAEGGILLLTVSAEYDESPDFIRRVVASGVVVSIGHTAANSDQIQAATDAGATSSTHLGNGAHGTLPRHPNYLWDQLADDRLTACLIADGHHLPDAVLKTFVRAKTLDRCVLVSDITGLGGLPAGRYTSTSIGNVEILEDGRLVVADQRQYLAGAALPLRQGVPQLMRAAGLSLSETLPLATTAAARLVGRMAGGLEVGDRADLICFRLAPQADALEILQTVREGTTVYEASHT